MTINQCGNIFIRCVVVFVLLGSLGACSSAANRMQYFTLQPLAETSAVQLPDVGAVGIGPIFLPGILDRKEVLSFTHGQRVLLSSHRYWAESLKTLAPRVIVKNIEQLTAYDNLWSHPWGARLGPVKHVEITVTELGGVLGGDIQLSAKWRLLDAHGKTLVAVKSAHLSTLSEKNDYDSYVRAINRLVFQLSERIAQSLTEYSF